MDSALVSNTGGVDFFSLVSELNIIQNTELAISTNEKMVELMGELSGLNPTVIEVAPARQSAVPMGLLQLIQ